jgi:hypothetical protein
MPTYSRRGNRDSFSEDLIPPAIRILMATDLVSHDAAHLLRDLKKLAPELVTQAQWTVDNFKYSSSAESRHRALTAVVSGGLNPFAIRGACQSPACRAQSAARVARTIGLYADVVLVPDNVTRILALGWKGSASDFEWLANQWIVVRLLAPMIRAGVVRFWSGALPICLECADKLFAVIEDSVAHLLGRRKIQVDIKHGHLVMDMTKLFGSPLVFSKTLTRTEKKKLRDGTSPAQLVRPLYLEQAALSLKSTLLDLRFASNAGASLFTTDRQQLIALNAFDSNAPALNRIAAWENPRSIQLPWLDNLSVAEVLALREEAASALPAFRASFVQEVVRSSGRVLRIADAIEKLRAEAADVEREISATAIGPERMFRAAYGLLGMGVTVYGLASGQPAAATAGLLSVLGLLHQSGRKDHQALATAKSHPAYVLVKAKELLEHASHHEGGLN